MTEPSQYFIGRPVQEQMDEVIGYVDVRSAEVATNAIAADVAQVHQDMLDADADAQAAAASAAAAAGTLANAVKKTGEASQSIAGDIAVAGTLSVGVVTGNVITAPAPVNNTDAATKKYVDDQDALKVSITDINQYAVGLTGDQSNIAGRKDFVFAPYSKKVKRAASNGTQWWKLWKMDATGANNLRMWFKLYTTSISTYLYVTVTSNGQNVTIVTFGSNRYPAANFKISVSGTELILWCKPMFSASRMFGFCVNETNVNYDSYSYWSVHEDTGQYAEPTTPDYDIVVTATYDGA